ncbi:MULTISPECIES: hypothetical protein [unclassified Bradyrhizobium]|uniref:hypothetical protein n=1 Tax=unclassified Bradyrhizobium TaxID=2631580 RepID=UPI0020B26986|nr:MULTISPECIES: hypothetical protein [unclassified Bradyrhizobium]MCP3379821.1 hypothetical protein [Bradyrhizobium sp. CCGUVB4N]MCP3440571.1 hypothetical protein [Bradyrhizobium sp. CCGUVB14]
MPLKVFSSLARWKVARLTSASSSSLSWVNWPGMTFSLCGASPAGTAAVAYALPASEKVSPATPRAGTAALVIRTFFEACFVRRMAASSKSGKNENDFLRASYAEQPKRARIAHRQDVERLLCNLHERHRGNFASSMPDHGA